MDIENIMFEGMKVGYILNGAIYVSPRKQSKHLYRGGEKNVTDAKKKGKASWGISNALLAVLKARGIELIVIHDSETKNGYFVGVERLEKEGYFLEFGLDLQKFLPLDSWQKAEYSKLLNHLGKVRKERVA